MLLRCHVAFGNFVPGDEVEVPDDAVFDRAHFGEAETFTPDEAEGEVFAPEEGNEE